MIAHKCILCNSHQLRALESFQVDRAVSAWKFNHGIDVKREFDGLESFTEYHCMECGLGFFIPAVTGSGNFYKDLQQLRWYYMPEKWEFSQALADLESGEFALEVGCGSGDFVEKALQKNIHIEGIEINEAAVSIAVQRGLPVDHIDLSDLASAKPGIYGAVCAFQVLEHVPDPRGFLEDCIALLKVGGKLLISVPNNLGFIQYDREDWLNRPPHHATHWSWQVFQAIPKLMQLKQQRLKYEPLADYHADWYRSVQKDRLARYNRTGRYLQWLFDQVFLGIVQPTGLYRHIRGHTMYVSLQKLDI